MRRVQIKEWSDYVKAVDVLIRVGGTFLGRETQVLIVTDEQYQKLVDAKVVPSNGKEAKSRGPKAKKRINALHRPAHGGRSVLPTPQMDTPI